MRKSLFLTLTTNTNIQIKKRRKTMFTKIRTNEKGFTLIELLIVVAIIGILAAIAIPQFAAYRQRAFNGSAQSDLRNVKTAEESLFADNQTYGITQNATLLAVTGGGAGGTVLTGPLGAATATVAGAAITGTTAQARIVGIGIALSNNVALAAYSEGTAVTAAASYVLYAKHFGGGRAFAAESENTGIFFAENPAWAGAAMTIGTRPNGPAASTTGADFVSGTTSAGGLPTDQWFLL